MIIVISLQAARQGLPGPPRPHEARQRVLGRDSREPVDPEALWQAKAERVGDAHGVKAVAEVDVVGRVDLEREVHL